MNNKILTILLVVAIGISATLNAYLFASNFQMQTQNNDLISERETLKAEVTTVVTERDEALQNLEPHIGINNALSAEIEAIEQERENLKAEIDSLVTERDEATSENLQLNSELTKKIDELDRLNASCVMTIGISGEDIRYSNPYSFRLTGYLVNAGVNGIFNVKVKLVAYDALGNLVINTTAYETSYIMPRNYFGISASVNYDGQPISNWSTTTEWSE